MSQVAVTEVAVVPVFKGFRRLVTNETDGAAKTASTGFSRAFAKTGTDSGKTVGAGFKKAFEQSAQGTSSKVTKALEADVAKTSRALSAARLKEQDSIGKVRLAQAQLNEANKKYEKDSSQVIRAQERLATASRQLETAHEGTERATDDLKRSQGELARAADRAGDELAEAGSRGVSGFRSNVVGGVKSFALPLIGAFAALGIGNIVADAFNEAKDFISGSIDIASDLKESVNAVQVSYGDAADEVLRLGENSAKAFGLSQGDLNAYATQFSAFVKTIAGDGGDVVGTLETLVGRGTDFASVFNLEVSEALGLFQSGLAGETEPLRKYGIDLSAAAVEAYALASGISDGTSELTEAQKQQARYGYLLEQTNAVQGDFINTSDELANKNRINAAEWENVQAKIGDAFLPVASELADILSNDVIPVIAELAEKHGPDLANAFADVLPELTELAEDLLPQLPGLIQAFIDGLPFAIQMFQLMADTLGPLIENIGGVLGAAQAISDYFTGDLGPAEYLAKLEGIGGGIGDVLSWAIRFSTELPAHFEMAKVAAGAKIDEIVAFVGSLPGRAMAALGDLGGMLFSSGQAFMGGFLEGIDSMFGEIGARVEDALDWVMGFFPHSPAKRGPLSGSGWTNLQKSGGAFWEQWVGGMGGEGPEFPTFGGGGGAPGAPGVLVAAPGSVTGPKYVQNNHIAHMPPDEAIEATGQRFASLARKARV